MKEETLTLPEFCQKYPQSEARTFKVAMGDSFAFYFLVDGKIDYHKTKKEGDIRSTMLTIKVREGYKPIQTLYVHRAGKKNMIPATAEEFQNFCQANIAKLMAKETLETEDIQIIAEYEKTLGFRAS